MPAHQSKREGTNGIRDTVNKTIDLLGRWDAYTDFGMKLPAELEKARRNAIGALNALNMEIANATVD